MADSRVTTVPLATSKLPVELWHTIFILSASIPGKDEFSLDPRAHGLLTYNTADISALLTKEEEEDLIQMRLSIAKVCKYWYSIGIQHLWSHLRIIGDQSESRIRQICDTISSKPLLASYVVRLTVSAPTRYNRNLANYLSQLAAQLSTLKILICPIWMHDTLCPVQTDIVIFTDSNEIYIGSHAPRWANARAAMLSEPLKRIYDVDLASVAFPRLQSLRVASAGNSVLQILFNSSIFPILRSLSISSSSGIYWGGYLERLGATLQELELDASLDPSIAVNLPRVERLYVSHNRMYAFLVIQAPNIRHMGVFNVAIMDGATMRQLNRILALFPKVEELQILGIRGQPIVWPDGISMSEVDAWIARGIRVDIQLF